MSNLITFTFKLASKTIQPHYLIACLLTTYVCITPSFDLFYYDAKRIAEISLILVTLMTLAASFVEQQHFINTCFSTNRKVLNILILILCLGVISAVLSPVPRQAFIEIITYFSLLLIALLCAPVWRNVPSIIPWVALGLLLSFSIQEVKFLGYYCAFLFNSDSFSYKDFFIDFAHPRFFNQYQLWTLPLLTILFLIDHPFLQKKYSKQILWGIAIFWWLMFFTTTGRGVSVAVIGSGIITYLIFRKKAATFLKQTFILAILGFVFFQILFYLIPNLIGSESSIDNALAVRTSSSGRLTHLWPKAITFMSENPWLGIGPMHYAGYADRIGAHPHNGLLQLAAEWGLPAFILILYLIYRTFHSWISRFNTQTLSEDQTNFNLLVIAVTFSLCSALIYSLVSGVIVMPMSHLTGVFVASLAMAVYQNKDSHTDYRTYKHSWVLTCIFTFFTVSYFWLLSPELIPRLVDPAYQSDNFVNATRPRFWLNGQFFLPSK